MKLDELSTCFCTDLVDECRQFYGRYFAARPVFDCGWYVSLRINGDGPTIHFMQPQGDQKTFDCQGVILNFKVSDVDAEHERLTSAGLGVDMPLEDHPWGDRGFSVLDPLGNSLYIYSDREPSEEYQQAYQDS